jgi:hypothetical protein
MSLRKALPRSDRFLVKEKIHDSFFELVQLLKTNCKEVGKMKRNFFVCLVVFIVALALALPAVAQDKKDKPKEERLKDVVIVKAAQPDASGKLSTIAIQTDKGTFPVLRNAIAKKMEEHVGSKTDVMGIYKDMEGKKVFEPWVFQRKVEGQTPRRLPSE